MFDARARGDLLVARDLSVIHAHPKRPLISNIFARFPPGRVTAIVGPSGAGKSTLAKALVGLEPGTSGSLRFRGTELVGRPPSEWRSLRRTVQLCWQDSVSALNPRLTLLASINEARILSGRPRWDEGATRLASLAGSLDLPIPLLRRHPPELSGGQCQRAALIRALATQPELLICDEITASLDRHLVWRVIDLLARLRRTNVGIVFITHDLTLVQHLAEDIIVLAKGRIVESGSTHTVLSSPVHTVTRSLVHASVRI
ncbi:MAG: dipeptide/oligopeptide/nickel ABC transporter ATP-binding protein [Nannocystaceae bacterium]